MIRRSEIKKNNAPTDFYSHLNFFDSKQTIQTDSHKGQTQLYVRPAPINPEIVLKNFLIKNEHCV